MVCLNPGIAVKVDVLVFQAVAKQALAGNDRLLLREAIDLYGGPLLPTLAYEEWTEDLRTALARLFERVLIRMSESQQPPDMALVESRLYGLLDIDPSNEAAGLALMRLLVRTGRRNEALRMYDRLVTALHDEFGLAPSRDLVAVRDDLLHPPAGSPAPDAVSQVELQREFSGVLTVLVGSFPTPRETGPALEVGSSLGTAVDGQVLASAQTVLVPADDRSNTDGLIGAALRRHLATCIGDAGGVTLHDALPPDFVVGIFSRVSSALEAACAIHANALPGLGDAETAARRPALAVHCGEVDLRKGSGFGPLLEYCTSLLAEAGESRTVVSRAAAHVAWNVLPRGAELHPLGRRLLLPHRALDEVYELTAAAAMPQLREP